MSSTGAGASSDWPPDHQADVDLVRRALARDAAAIDQLTARMGCIGRILAARNRRYGRLLQSEDLQDLAQDVAATVWSHLGSYRGLGSLESWTHSYCDHAFRNAVRRRLRDRRMGELSEELHEPSALPAPPALDDPLYGCLGRLAAMEQWMLQRKYHEGATLEEIARAIDSNLNTVKSRYARALKQLRQCLEAKGSE